MMPLRANIINIKRSKTNTVHVYRFIWCFVQKWRVDRLDNDGWERACVYVIYCHHCTHYWVLMFMRLQWMIWLCMMTSSNRNIFRVTALCAGNSPVTGEFPSQRPATRNFDAFFDMRLNKRWSKQSICRWYQTPTRSLWRQCNDGWERAYVSHPCTHYWVLMFMRLQSSVLLFSVLMMIAHCTFWQLDIDH